MHNMYIRMYLHLHVPAAQEYAFIVMLFTSAVREKAKSLVSLLKDPDRLKEERDRSKQARQRLLQSNASVSSDSPSGRE